MPQKGELKVPKDLAWLMTGVAIFLDLLCLLAEAIPVIGTAVSFALNILITGIFFLWLGHYEIKLFSDKNVTGSFIAFLLNALPFTDITFPWAFRVGALVFNERKDPPREVKMSISKWRL